MPVFLNYISVSGLCENYYNQRFIGQSCKIDKVNHIRLSTNDDENMWSCLIEIICSIADDLAYPCLDHDWEILIEYSVWGEPLVYYDRPSQIITLKIECQDGKITEESYRDDGTNVFEMNYNARENRPNYSKFLPEIKQDLADMPFYRWNPRLSENSISAYENYFLKMHDSWYRSNPENYVEEMESILSFINPHTFGHLDIKVNELSNKISYFIVEKNVGNVVEIRSMDDDFKNFFYSYAQFKRFKDYESAFMAFFMTDCKAPIYISAFTTMLVESFNDINSQFFFIYWEEAKIDKMWITHIKQQDI